MHAFSRWVLALFASPVGVVVLAALDSTVFFSLPLGIDAAVVLLAARQGSYAWIVPVLATSGSIGGALLTFWMGEKVGEKGLERYISPRRLIRMRKRIQSTGAIALAVLDLIPPPFPFTLFVLAAGTLGVSRSRFFITLTVCRLVRFGGEALLAVVYGREILTRLESDRFHDFVAVLIILALVVSLVSATRLLRPARPASGRRAVA